MQITAEIVQTYNLQNVTAQLYLKFLLITHHEDPFIDASEATKRARDRTENGKCTNVTNRRSRVRLELQTYREIPATDEIHMEDQNHGLA